MDDNHHIKKQIKILYFQLFTWLGGGEYGIYYLVKNLDKSRFVPFVMFNKRGPMVNKIEELGIETIFLKYDVAPMSQLLKPTSIWQNLKASFMIRKFIIENEINLVQCSDVLSLILLFPMMITVRVPIVFSIIFTYKPWRALLVNFFALFGIRKIVSLSKWILDDLYSKTYGLRKKGELVYWAIDTNIFQLKTIEERENIRQRLGLPKDKKIVGFVGRFDVWKGHMTFIEAAKNIINARNDTIFLIVGDAITKEVAPPVYRYYKEVVKRVEEYKFDGKLLMWSHRDDVPDIMSCMDIFVCPSENEPFGLVILEAMASGVPVIASDSGGPLEIIENGSDGFLFRTKNANSLEEALSICLDYPDKLTRLKQAARQKVETKFTMTNYTQSMEKIYESVLTK